MAELKVKNLNKVNSQLRKKFIKALRDKKILKMLGKDVTDDIKKKRWGDPSDDYQIYRSKITNKKDPTYRENRLNLTITGELMNDLMKNVKFSRVKDGVGYEIKQSEKHHKPYTIKGKDKKTGKVTRKKTGRDLTDKKGKTKRVGAKFTEIQEGLSLNGYVYLKISDKVLDAALKKIRKILFDNLKKG